MAFPFILYTNIYESGTISATSEASGFDVENVIDWRSYVRWKATSTATQYVYVDYGSAVSCDSLGIAGHNLSGATISVESSTTGAWSGEQVTRLSGFTPSNNSDICKPFTSASARYWRTKILTPSSIPEIGVLCLGARMDFQDYPDAPLDYKNVSPKVAESVSKGGHLLGVVTRYDPYTFSLNFSYVANSWVESDLDSWWDHAKLHKPFFVNINSDVWSDGRFCRMPESFSYAKSFPNTEYLDISLDFEGVL